MASRNHSSDKISGKKKPVANRRSKLEEPIEDHALVRTPPGFHIDASWLWLLYRKAFSNNNPSVRRWTVASVLNNTRGLPFSVEFVLGMNGLDVFVVCVAPHHVNRAHLVAGPLLHMLAQNILYRGTSGLSHIVRSCS